MITPDPVLMEMECGREFSVSMGKFEEKEEEETKEIKKVWKEFPFVESSQCEICFFSEKGVCRFENITYEETEEFKGDTYIVKIEDITQNAPNKLEDTHIQFNIISKTETPALAKGKGKPPPPKKK